MSEPPTPPDLPPEDSPNDEAPAAPEVPPVPPPSEAAAPPPPPPSGATAGGSESPNRSLMIVLSYLWILALVPLLTEKEDQEVQWHAKHGLVLMGAELALMLVLSFLTTIPGLGCLAVLAMPLLSIGILVVHVICIVKGTNGDRFLIPGLSQYADKF